MAAMITSSILNPKSLIASPNNPKPTKLQPSGILRPLQRLTTPINLRTATGAAVATSLLAPLLSSNAASAEEIAGIAEAAGGSDNRSLILLIPVVTALGWVLYNILQPALNQLNRMREDKGVIVGVGLSAAAASGLLFTPTSESLEIAQIAEASSDNRGLLLLFVISPALVWVLYNILQPALNQLNRMRSE